MLPRTHASAAFFLALLALVLFLPGFFTLPPMDRDEPRFAQASKQMRETGDFVVIRFQDEARNKKPAGIYWLQAAAVAAGESMGVPQARTTIWLYRLPSLLGALATVLLTYWAALPFLNCRNAFLATMLMATTLLLTVEARLAKTDAVVAATVVAAMGALARVWMNRTVAGAGRLADAAIFWTALAIGILVKGPITPMVPAFAAMLLSLQARSARWLLPLRPLAGMLWCLASVAPWLVLIALETHGAFFSDAIGGDMLGKVASGKEAHGAPPLTYLAAFWLTAWPMAPFAALAAPFARKNWRDERVLFALCWLVPSWLLFEAVPTKLPHYVLPLYPAIAVLTGLALEGQAMHLAGRWRKAVAGLLPLLAVLVPLAAVAASLWFESQLGIGFAAMAAACIALAVVAARAIAAEQFGRVLGLAPALALAAIVTAFATVLTTPAFDPFALSPRLAAARAAATISAKGCAALVPATAGYREPSLVFLTRTDLAMTDGAGAATFLNAGQCRIAFVEIGMQPAFAAALLAQSKVVESVRIAGINLNSGKKLDIGVYVRQGDAP